MLARADQEPFRNENTVFPRLHGANGHALQVRVPFPTGNNADRVSRGKAANGNPRYRPLAVFI